MIPAFERAMRRSLIQRKVLNSDLLDPSYSLFNGSIFEEKFANSRDAAYLMPVTSYLDGLLVLENPQTSLSPLLCKNAALPLFLRSKFGAMMLV